MGYFLYPVLGFNNLISVTFPLLVEMGLRAVKYFCVNRGPWFYLVPVWTFRIVTISARRTPRWQTLSVCPWQRRSMSSPWPTRHSGNPVDSFTLSLLAITGIDSPTISLLSVMDMETVCNINLRACVRACFLCVGVCVCARVCVHTCVCVGWVEGVYECGCLKQRSRR